MRTATHTGENAPADAPEGKRRGTGALSGVLSAGLTLGVGQLVAGIVSPSAAPLVVVGAAVVDRVPAGLKDFAIRTFGAHDKVVLLATIAVLVTLLAALAGVLARRRLAVGVGLVGALGLVGVLAAATRPDATPLSPLPSVLGAGAGAYALTVLTRRLAGPALRAAGGPRRRAVLLGGTAVAAAATGGAGQLLVTTRSAEDSRAGVVLPAPADPAPPLPAGLDPADALASGLTTYATRTADFYRVDTALVVPDVRAEDWSLRVHGLVDRELTLSFDDVLAMPLRERWITLTCVSNEVGGSYVGTARWLGYPLAELLERAGVRAGADMLYATSTDGFTLSTPLAEATDGRDAMLVVGMNGEPLPREHGFPVRLVVPGLYGYVSACKWVTDLEVTRFADKTAYWTDRGWAAKGPIKTASRIDVPRSFAKLRAGRVPVAGVAWAQHRGISAVEVRVDEGEWRPAKVLPSASEDTWCQWVYDWDASEPGNHTVQVRAVDGTGEPQTDVVAAPIPDGSSGYDSVSVTVE
ncbi:molybdopterin-dependent oxidoreductase [Kineococcus radiotolerans]|uniref:Oxidoreductase molybdopterin binding n=1 Tax=Kineococcus radiotolerans (strain ATCC BAA-149 / DSM 14245 / SRS30216) TaxID=266940 RepID=A6WEI5_KINRD|nr:molybdopterin-dependent oxidoreductase [Kineococcus radiotolerans]ABS05224.1 oxidoreductase molybdopterin binding [Kineococcus radiotolerans SRS30216 = ATCC BAA-149]